MELVNLLTNQLGISEDQAQGAAGLLFKMAKEKLSTGDFSQITEHVPGLDSLMEKAPASGGLGSALSGLTSSLTGGDSKLAGLASLAGGFSKLGLDSDMIGKFVPVILSFLKDKGGDSLSGLLSKVLD